MDTNEKPDPAKEQDKQELDDLISRLMHQVKTLSFDEDSDDDFHPGESQNKPEYKTCSELFLRRIHRWEAKNLLRWEYYNPLIYPKPISYDEAQKGITPEFQYSITITSLGHWDIGSLIRCEKVEPGHEVPPDSLCQWVDEGSTYYLQKRPVPLVEPAKGDHKTGCVRASTRGLWNISPNVFCKTQAWVEGTTPDSDSIRFVNKNIPSIPTEEVIYDWVDPAWRRWFMLTKRVPGTRFQEAWPSLSLLQRIGVAQDLARHSKALATFTSDYLETVTGQGVAETKSRLMLRDALPHGVPRVEPRVSKAEYKEYLDEMWGKRNIVYPEPTPFVLAHGDLTPGNIFVEIPKDRKEMAKVTAIIDWQMLAYEPKWCLATAPRYMYSYAVDDASDGWHWTWMLSNALYDEGFPIELDFIPHIAPHKGCIVDKYLPWERDKWFKAGNKATPKESTKSSEGNPAEKHEESKEDENASNSKGGVA